MSTIDLKTKYQKEIRPALKKEFGVKNIYAVPSIKKVVINVGIGKMLNTAAQSKNVDEFLKQIKQDVSLITGQWPKESKAKKSVSSFKIREGDVVGLTVTLRGQKMYDFLGRLINIALPRIRDFRGIPVTNLDEHGNLNIGIPEASIFPEVTNSVLKHPFGLEVSVIINDKNKERVVKMLKSLGFPIK
ncbi:MAG: 50S ribosomal protein L5 [Candidatus Pacebacteria bacterium]|nr:50S ribosomal protein L5 [Candidatus Paceibacterota bacterium]